MNKETQKRGRAGAGRRMWWSEGRAKQDNLCLNACFYLDVRAILQEPRNLIRSLTFHSHVVLPWACEATSLGLQASTCGKQHWARSSLTLSLSLTLWVYGSISVKHWFSLLFEYGREKPNIQFLVELILPGMPKEAWQWVQLWAQFCLMLTSLSRPAF